LRPKARLVQSELRSGDDSAVTEVWRLGGLPFAARFSRRRNEDDLDSLVTDGSAGPSGIGNRLPTRGPRFDLGRSRSAQKLGDRVSSFAVARGGGSLARVDDHQNRELWVRLGDAAEQGELLGTG